MLTLMQSSAVLSSQCDIVTRSKSSGNPKDKVSHKKQYQMKSTVLNEGGATCLITGPFKMISFNLCEKDGKHDIVSSETLTNFTEVIKKQWSEGNLERINSSEDTRL